MALSLRRPLCGLLLLLLVAAVLTDASLERTGRAVAGTTGGPYGVYVSTGSSEQQLSLANLAGGSSPVINNLGEVTVTALNSTATIGVATTYSDFPAGGTVQIFRLPGNNLVGSLPIAAVGYAMDPVDPNVAFSVTSGGEVDAIKLGAATSTTLANLNPGVSFTATSIAATPDGSLVLVGGISNSFGFIDAVPTGGGAVRTWQGGLRDFQVDDLAVAPDGSAVFAVADAPGFSPPIHLFRLSLAGFNPKTVATWSDPSAANPIVVTAGRSLTVSRDGQTVYLAGLNANGQSEIQSVAAATGMPTGSRSLSIGAISNGNGGFDGGVNSIAISPDGQTLLALGASFNAAGGAQELLYPISTTGLVVGPTPAPLGNNTPVGPEDIAVTPDQAPAANLSPAAGTAGIPLTLNASASNVTYGQIKSYLWKFGDGSSQTTSGPTVNHTYASAGSYTASVVETDIAGTSIPPAPATAGWPVNGPGTTPYLHASFSATISAPIAIGRPGAPPPPTPTTAPPAHGTTTTTTVKPATPGFPGFHPTLTLQPTVGAPGTIVMASGHGFPPNKSVTVGWSTKTGSFAETTDAHGNLPAHELDLLTPDLLGPRSAFAVIAGTPLPSAAADFLVVPNTAEPGGGDRLLFRSEGP